MTPSTQFYTLAQHDPHPPRTSYTPPPRLQQRTSRSFVAESPPDGLATWLMKCGFVPVAKSHNQHEYGRFKLGDELMILYWNGSVVASGALWEKAAQRLVNICEAEPPQATLFDLLDQEGGA